MGNRAIITTKKNFDNNGIGVYLHWNGGRDSVQAFLTYCKLKGYRPPEDDCYGWARLCQVIGNYFGGSLSIGIDNFSQDAGEWQDNGTYIIENWEIVDRKYFDAEEQDSYDLQKMLHEIDVAQPVSEQLGDFLDANEIATSEIKVGDIVFIKDIDEHYKQYKVVGKGKDKYINGHNVKGIPYVAQYADVHGNYDWNINNYILTETIRVKEKVMPTYLIYDANELRTHQVIREVQASNAKQALIKFRNTLSSTGMYEIRKIKDGCWEMSSTYGAYFYCTKKEESK